MGDSASTVAGSSAARTDTITTQRFVRRVGGVSPFVWRGLLPLLGLAGVTWFGIAPFASRDIEATVAREVRAQLVDKDMAWVKTVVSGQEVLLSGTPPRAGAGDDALAVARAATCPTWAGPLTCAVTVLGVFAAPAAAPAAPAASPAAASSPASAAAVAAAACEAEFAKLLSTARIEFVSGSAVIGAASAKLLDQLAQAARGCPGSISIEGHTDDIGEEASNLRLSEARAGAVLAALVQRGVARERLRALGHGESKPLAANDSDAGRAANRRIEFKALP
jgi:outer membrane protein OmpA-like peptidoglycan-associated protein